MEKSNISKIKAIIGIGNPGDKYSDTYHNAGILFLQDLVSRNQSDFNIQIKTVKHFSYTKTEDKILGITSTFMNNSGTAIKEFIDYFKLSPEEILIAHDDSDQSIGNYKITFGQSSGGHNGIQDIINTLKTQDFWRLKIGVRPEKEIERKKSEEFVLKRIKKSDTPKLLKVFKKASEEIIS